MTYQQNPQHFTPKVIPHHPVVSVIFAYVTFYEVQQQNKSRLDNSPQEAVTATISLPVACLNKENILEIPRHFHR